MKRKHSHYLEQIVEEVESTSLWQELFHSRHHYVLSVDEDNNEVTHVLNQKLKSRNIEKPCMTETKTTNKGSEGLFGHVPFEPFEMFPKKPQPLIKILSQGGSYRWNKNEPDYEALPQEEKFTAIDIFGVRAVKALIAEKTLKYTDIHLHFEPSSMYIDFDAPCSIGPCLKEKYNSDISFGMQRFQGVNPSMVTFDGEALKLDYSSLKKYELKLKSFGPRCTLSLDKEGTITPQEIDLGNGVVLKREETWAWRYAKLVVQVAEFTHHELVDHLTKCHFVSEIFAMETSRQWRNTNNNSIYLLLIPHFSRVMAVNKQARQLLIPWIKDHLSILSPRGIDQLIADELRDFSDFDFPSCLKKRGFNSSSNALPSTYFYAQDGLRLWTALLTFVEKAINVAMVDWSEVETWSRNIQMRLPHFPEIKDLTTLHNIVTGIIFNASIQHSALNDPQYYFFGYVPNGPATLRKDIPSVEVSQTFTDDDWKQYYFDSLPCRQTCSLQRDLVSILALGAPENSSLMECTEEYRSFLPQNLVDDLQSSLKQISDDIRERNEYTWLDPMKTTRSVIR
jgi:Lipoxygenase